MSDYPEHDKLKARKAEHETLVDFFRWAERTERYDLGEWFETKNDRDPGFAPTIDSEKARIIAEYLDIDHDAFMDEKDAMFRKLQGDNRAAQQG